MHNGATVAVINETYDGRLYIEAMATIVEKCRREFVYKVRFPAGFIAERFIDPRGQADPEGYVALPAVPRRD